MKKKINKDIDTMGKLARRHKNYELDDTKIMKNSTYGGIKKKRGKVNIRSKDTEEKMHI